MTYSSADMNKDHGTTINKLVPNIISKYEN